MADVTADIDQLSDAQREMLQTYTSVTDQGVAEAISLLNRSQWNLQIAIAKFFDGEQNDLVEEARAALSAQSPHRRQVLLDNLPGSSSFPERPWRDIAPRIVPPPIGKNTYNVPLLFLIIKPITLVFRILFKGLRLVGSVFPIFPRFPFGRKRYISSDGQAQDTAARFVRGFEEEYGSHQLNFFRHGYAQAYDRAKNDVKFLLVIILSSEHDDNSTFIRETLLSLEFATLMQDPNIILWAGNVQDSEAYQVSDALRCTKFPFSALVVQTPQDSSGSMSTVARLSGQFPPTTFISELKAAMSRHSPALASVRVSKVEQQASRNIRSEQNSAYEKSLAQDRERARQKRKAEAEALRIECEEQVKLQKLEEQARQREAWKIWKSQHLALEPGPDVKDILRISFRLPSGERVVRRFFGDALIEDLYAFVECYSILKADQLPFQSSAPHDYTHTYDFNLVSPMPRAVFALEGGKIIDQIGKSGNLIVEPIHEDEAED